MKETIKKNSGLKLLLIGLGAMWTYAQLGPMGVIIFMAAIYFLSM